METTEINGKPYPVKDGHRTHYIRKAVQVTESMAETADTVVELIPGKWITVDVSLDGGYFIPVAPGQMDDEDYAERAAANHNKWLGFTEEEVDTIVGMSMAAAKKGD